MKTRILAACLATVFAAPAAFAQQTTVTPGTAPTQTTAPGTTATTPATPTAGGPFYTVQAPAAGQMPMSHLASDIEGFDVYGANNEKIGEIEDLVVNSDGRVAAAVIEVGGFLGIGEKNVLVNFDALKMRMEGDEMRVSVDGLTKDSLTNAPNTDLKAVFPDHD